MAQKKVKRPSKPSPKKRKSGPASGLAEAQSLSLSAPSPSPMGGKLKGILVAGFVIFVALVVWKHHHSSGSGASDATAPAQENPTWGPRVKMEPQGQFKFSGGEVEGLQVDAQGAVYILTHTAIFRYVGGQVTGTLDLKINGEYMNMSSDDKALYVTEAYDPVVRRVPMDLSGVQKIKIAGAKSLLGIAVSPGRIYAGDIEEHMIHIRDGQGRGKTELGGPKPEEGGIICPRELALDRNGDIYGQDDLSTIIYHFKPSGTLLGSWPVPWSSHAGGWERLCILQGKIYISGYNDNRLFVQDLQGKNLAQCQELTDGTGLDHPQMVCAGKDGSLYIKCADTIFKLKPWGSPGPEEAAAPAAAAVSPSAAK
jgi:hypothetical protein